MGSNKVKMVSAREFYNEIADNYDKQLSFEKDQKIRQDIAAYFQAKIPFGNVLDFGGGTGLDLNWLTVAGYQVYFCEPAEKMRAIAKSANSWSVSKPPVFLESEQHDYKKWSLENNPFDIGINAILANFGVINYIDDLDKLFDIFAKITDKEADLILSLLKVPSKIIASKLLKNAIKAFVKREPIRAGSSYKNIGHETILYKIKAIQKSAQPHFKLVHSKVLGNDTDFTMLHFKKV